MGHDMLHHACDTLLNERAGRCTGLEHLMTHASLEVLQNTLKTFKVNKNDLDTEEAEKKHTFDMAQGARLNQIKAFEATLAESEKEAGLKGDAKGVAEEEKTKTVQEKTADNTFMDDLTSQCEEKAKAWDARSKTRSMELTAIAEATKTLKGEVAGNYAAKKKLMMILRGSPFSRRGKATQLSRRW